MSRKKGQLVKDRATQRLKKSARKLVVPLVKDIKALIHAQALFQSSLKMSQDLHNNIDDRDVWARQASTRAIIVEYAKPWSNNNDQYLRHFGKIDGYLGTLVGSDQHKELLKLRDTLAAHTDGGVHPVAVVAIGTSVNNDYPMDQRYDNAFLTVRIRSESVYALGFAEKSTVRRYMDHIQRVEETTRNELSTKMKMLQVHLVRFAPVVHELSDVIGIMQVEEDGDSRRVPDVSSGPASTDPIQLATSDGVLRTVVGRMESSNSISPKLSSTGPSISSQVSGANVSYEVSFTDIDLTKLDEATSK